MDYAFNRAHFCMYDNSVLVKPAHAAVVNGECRYTRIFLISNFNSDSVLKIA